MSELPDYSAQTGYEPRGGNMYRAHTLQCNSGEFWRCKHGRTGLGPYMVWLGCGRCAVLNVRGFLRFSTAHRSILLWPFIIGRALVRFVIPDPKLRKHRSTKPSAPVEGA